MTPEEVKAKKVVVTHIDGQDVVLRDEGDKIVALSAVCTHQGCVVEYNAADNSLDCPCHGSNFDLNGHVVIGPAKSPLKILKTKIENNQIKIEQ